MLKQTHRMGFTVVELLVVIVIIGILAGLTLISFSGINAKATVATIKSDLSSSSRILKVYQVDNGYYPAQEDVSVCTDPDPGKVCLKLTEGNQLDSYTRPTLQSYILKIKDSSGSKIWMITSNTEPSEVAPITAIAAISGEVKQGNVLSAGALTPSGATATYQWQKADTSNGTYSNIAGATQSTYTPTSNDVGKFLKIIATGSGSYTGTVTSAPTGAVASAFTPATYYFRSDGVLGPNVTGSSASNWIVWDGGSCGTFTSSVDIKVEKWDTSWTVVSDQGAAPRYSFTNSVRQNDTINYSFPGATSSTNNLKIRVTIRGMMTGSPSNTHSTIAFTTGDLGTKSLPAGTWGIVYRTIHNYANDCGEMENEDGAWAHVFYGGSDESRITNFGGL